MSSIDEQKLKLLLRQVVRDIFSCMEPNQYRASVEESIYERIERANLLTDQAPCATVKAQIKQASRRW
jgi:hypothetical protein